ncbi:GumC family protein [Methylopila henanensis]|uniref:GumC family protein n=1 Tax=Methylopila henanensis TaxID=873516 RepID=A0ABW4KAP2_9HYPH
MGDEAMDRRTSGAPAGAAVWPYAFAVLLAHLRRALWVVVALVLLGVLIGVAVKATLPKRYAATAQLLIDPRALQVFPNEMVNNQLDANAAINFVESQMQMLTSERVLARLVRDEGLDKEPGFAADGEPSDAGLRGPLGPDAPLVDSATLTALRKALTVKRGERSYLVDVTATASSPDLATRIANGTVKAFMAEDAESRADSGRRLTKELTGRLETLRARLGASEAKAEAFRRDNGLTASGDKLVIEQRLEEAVTEAGAAQARLARAESRAQQLDRANRDLGSLGSLTATEDMRTVSYLIERLSAARENMAELNLNLGPRHPALTSARSRVDEIERRIRAELDRIRQAAQADLVRARGEQEDVTKRVASLTADLGKARQAQIELGALEQEVKANRDLLTSFETRSREADEFGRISAINLRVASGAVPARAGSQIVATAAWAILGGALGLLLALGGVALWAMISVGRVAKRRGGAATPPAAASGPAQAPANPVRAAAAAAKAGANPPGRGGRDLLQAG